MRERFELNVGLAERFSEAHKDGVVITTDHFQKALDQLRSSHSDAIGAPKVSSTHINFVFDVM